MNIQTVGQFAAELARDAQRSMMQASQIVRATAFLCQREAKQRVPVDTGFLRSSITVGGIYGEPLRPGAMSAQVGPEARYGAYVEYGTANRPEPRPYMVPAAERASEWMMERMSRDVGMQ